MKLSSSLYITPMRLKPLSLFATALISTALIHASNIPPRKIALIQKAMDVMHLRSKMDGFINRIVTVKVQRIKNDNPDASDSTISQVHDVIAGVYNENLDGNDDALYPQLYEVVDKYLTEDDLKFVMNYNASDGGQRYAKLAPRVIQEASDVEKKWNDALAPIIKQRVKDQFPDLKLGSME